MEEQAVIYQLTFYEFFFFSLQHVSAAETVIIRQFKILKFNILIK
jgi:hypothetical protein